MIAGGRDDDLSAEEFWAAVDEIATGPAKVISSGGQRILEIAGHTVAGATNRELVAQLREAVLRPPGG